MPLTGTTIAFDLDGTLVDTAPDLIGVLNHMLAEDGLPPVPLSSARHLVGGGAVRLLQHGYQEAGANFDAAASPERVQAFIDLYLARIARESRPFDGCEAVLDRLAAEGARLCVCTNKLTALSVALLEALGLLGRFQAVAGQDAVSRRKPDGAHFLEAVRMAGGDPARAVMVGDSAMDVLCARAAGAPVVVTTFGYTEIPPAELGGDVLVERFDQIPDAVRRLLG